MTTPNANAEYRLIHTNGAGSVDQIETIVRGSAKMWAAKDNGRRHGFALVRVEFRNRKNEEWQTTRIGEED